MFSTPLLRKIFVPILLLSNTAIAGIGSSQNVHINKSINKDLFLNSRINLSKENGFTGETESKFYDLSLGVKTEDSNQLEIGLRKYYFFGPSFTIDENRLQLIATHFFKTANIKGFVRGRIENRFYDQSDSRIRSRIETNFSLLSQFHVRPNLGAELFYEPENEGLNMVWLSFGGKTQLDKNLGLKLGLKQKIIKGNQGWSKSHQFTTNFFYKFP